MPDVTYPSITVRVGYGGVGPQEIEELIVRPLEQSLAAVPGLEQINSTANEGSGQVRLSFAWGSDLNESADEVRIARRSRARPAAGRSRCRRAFRSSTRRPPPSWGSASSGNFDRVTLREIAEHDLVPRLERVEGVAAVTVNGGLRRQIHIELSKEKITALDLSVDRVISTLRTENQNVPLGEVDEGDTTYLLRSQGQFQNIDQIRDLVIMTKGGVPVYLRDIAEVKDTTEDLRSFQRIDGKPGVRMQVTKQSGKNTVAIADRRQGRDRADQPELGRAPDAARRPVEVHHARDLVGDRARLSRRDSRRRHHLRVPAQRPLDAHHLHVDSDLGHRHVRAALLRRASRSTR